MLYIEKQRPRNREKFRNYKINYLLLPITMYIKSKYITQNIIKN